MLPYRVAPLAQAALSDFTPHFSLLFFTLAFCTHKRIGTKDRGVL